MSFRRSGKSGKGEAIAQACVAPPSTSGTSSGASTHACAMASPLPLLPLRRKLMVKHEREVSGELSLY